MNALVIVIIVLLTVVTVVIFIAVIAASALVTVAVREKPKGDRFVSEMSGIFPEIEFGAVAIDGLAVAATEVDLIFNATPIGSGDAPLPVARRAAAGLRPGRDCGEVADCRSVDLEKRTEGNENNFKEQKQ